MTSQTIKTRFLILSDTHGTHLPENRKPKQSIDVVIHCGNLTKESKLKEFQTATRLLESIDAPLKLVGAESQVKALSLILPRLGAMNAKWRDNAGALDKHIIELHDKEWT